MTRKLSITTAVAVAALGIGAPAALANSVEPVPGDAFTRAVQAKQALESGVTNYRDAHERGSVTVLGDGGIGSTLAGYHDAFERAAAFERARSSGLSTYKDASERSGTVEPQWMTALRIRNEALNKQYGLGEFATNSVVTNYRDAFERAELPRVSVPVSAPSSGTEIEWPQVGVGLGIGILLALGLGLIMRIVHIRPFAH